MNTPAPRPHAALPVRNKVWRILGWTGGGLLLLVTAAALAVWLVLRASLPQLDGSHRLAGLGAAVTVTRDALGTPTINAATRLDQVRALGFLHAQERYFQMDLQRRAAAGELSALFGPKALATDRRLRAHGFRGVARQSLAALPAADRALVDAYAAGVNEGLTALGARPFEYQLLQSAPEPWLPEDSLLSIHAMYLQLQDSDGEAERQRALIRAATPDLEAFLYGPAADWQAPLFGAPLPAVPLPAAPAAELPAGAAAQRSTPPQDDLLSALFRRNPDELPGSNNWALAGRHTASGAALVANDMHLGLRVTNTWYRARLELRGADGALASALTGVTLPGTPVMVAGSNGHVAWGFTNSYVDTSDLVVLVPDPAATGHYLTPAGSRALAMRPEVIRVKGGADVTVDVEVSEFGPVVAKDPEGRRLALQWVAHAPEATSLAAAALGEARTVAEALAASRTAGMPAQNLTVGDAAGDIAWTIIGPVPQRAGVAPEVPLLSTDPAAPWTGVGPVPTTLPRLNPADGRIWTANARVGGAPDPALPAEENAAAAAYAALGGYSFDRAARAGQIRDDLAKLGGAAPADFLAVHLDDRALFLARWQAVALRAAETAKLAAADRALLAAPFTAASTDSTSYRLVRAFRREVSKQLYRSLTSTAQARAKDFEFHAPGSFEGPLWQLVSTRPAAYAPAGQGEGQGEDKGGWDAFLGRALVTALEAEREACGGALAGCTWGRANTAAIRHPMSSAVPGLARLVDMPATPLPGDADMPLVQGPTFGASERFAVSPGREAEGYLMMPSGNAGHPLSPYYRAGHADWEQGRPTPFLPGPARWTLALVP